MACGGLLLFTALLASDALIQGDGEALSLALSEFEPRVAGILTSVCCARRQLTFCDMGSSVGNASGGAGGDADVDASAPAHACAHVHPCIYTSVYACRVVDLSNKGPNISNHRSSR